MKLLTILFTLLISINTLACGGYWYEEMDFYNLFKQTNISAKAYYPFLRDADDPFYHQDGDLESRTFILPEGNVKLWGELLPKWTKKEISNAVYHFKTFNWSSKTSKLEKRVKSYLEFANHCSKSFEYRRDLNSWNYDEIMKNNKVDAEKLLTTAVLLLKDEQNEQLQLRYYYQIIRILHYSKKWSDAIKLFEAKVQNKYKKNEIYYYVLDQVAGCYYSTGNYEKAAYLYTKVLNHSIDRKESAFVSFNFCTYQNAEGKAYFKSNEDKKDLLLIKSLRDFTDEVNNIKTFIKLDANDDRVELLFMRALNNVERLVWPKTSYFYDKHQKTLPDLKDVKHKHIELLTIAKQQSKNSNVKNKDFWLLSASYLNFINQDIASAYELLEKVRTYPNQKKTLEVAYEIFTWKTVTSDNEKYIYNVLNDFPFVDNDWYDNSENDFRKFILDKLAHIYFINDDIAKSFLVHHPVEDVENIFSLDLLLALEDLYNKPNKNNLEKMFVSKVSKEYNFLDYINHQKGVYYLYDKQPKLALTYFDKNTSFVKTPKLSNYIFSNNTTECFNCDVESVMEDEVFKATVFDFIKAEFTRKELAGYLVQLETLTHNETQWKAKLANYLLGNYYFNISNTGYFRGTLTNRSRNDNYYYFDANYITAEKMIKNKNTYNLLYVWDKDKSYFDLSSTAYQYYQKVIDLSKDKELNARCLYMMAKCELNDFYNNWSDDFIEIKLSSYETIYLPKYKSFDLLNRTYSDTKFNKMILEECSYYRLYIN